MPPTITMPPIISALGSPLALLTNCARPIVPAAPPLLSNCTDCTTLADCIAAPSARPVWSQPPPGLAGIIILSVPNGCACAGGSDGTCASSERGEAASAAREKLATLHGFLRTGLRFVRGR